MRLTYCFLLLAIVAAFNGCTRTRYRVAADRDSYGIVQEKSCYITEPANTTFSVRPDSRSRFYDPTNPDCPRLPVPNPVLNSYRIPELASKTGDCSACRPCLLNLSAWNDPSDPNAPLQPQLPVVPASFYYQDPVAEAQPLELNASNIQSGVTTAEGYSTPILNDAKNSRQPEILGSSSEPNSAQRNAVQGGAGPSASEPVASGSNQTTQTGSPNSNDNDTTNSFYRTIPPPAWEVLPPSCLTRMLEFPSIRTEYIRSYPDARDRLNQSDQQRLQLSNLMELALLNSREYQTAKETLFKTALALTAQRYQYDLNPLQSGNGTASRYTHTRTDGATLNQMAIPTGVGVQKNLATAGQFLATFANSVVLTFNGPTGFAADVSSNLVFDFQQTVFQRDVRFENLTRAEREVVYAMRDYLRFRKQLFRDVSGLYYNLLLSYRSIEISTLDYFTNLRGFLQSQSEYRTAEKIPRVQVDQFEQNVLRTQGNLVNNCFALETALDQFKFRLGLPTEMPILIDLTELESISLRDELGVARQMIDRARNELMIAKGSNVVDVTTLANVAEVLADRMANILRIQQRIEDALDQGKFANPEMRRQGRTALESATNELQSLQRALQILGVRMQVEALRAELDALVKDGIAAPPLLIMNRSLEYCMTQLQVIDLALTDRIPTPALDKLKSQRDQLADEMGSLQTFLVDISSQLRSSKDLTKSTILTDIPKRATSSQQLVVSFEKLAAEAIRDIIPDDGTPLAAKVQQTVDKTIQLSDRLLSTGPVGWEEIVLDHNETLLTGLVQRLDLMNQRGRLADAWRQIKLAGDDLKSVVDLRATQVIGTQTGSNNPFDFSFDNSQTRLSAALDTPLNRRIQRNTFRVALINYNVGLRNLMAAEDSIKLDLREDLRQLSLDRNQYSISIASAALAYERVISTRLRLQLAVQGVAARDFLEAQQAYTNALNSIARQHVNYITDRIELFFDLEEMPVDECGYWEGVTRDSGPRINLDFPNRNPQPYGTLPPKVRYSPTVRQIEQVPPGNVEVR